MTQDELIKAVAIAMCNATNLPVNANDTFTTADGQTVKRWELMRGQAKAAIAIIRAETLEEAARVATDGPCGQPEYAWDYWCGYGNGKRAAAAAIRALKEKP